MAFRKHKNQSKTAVRPKRKIQQKLDWALHKRFVLVIGLVILLAGGSVLYWVEQGASPATTTVPLFPRTLLVFQDVQGAPATNSTITLVRTNGTRERQLSGSYADSTFDQYAGSLRPFSSGLLLSNQLGDATDISVTKWSVLHDTGETTSIPRTLVGTLNSIWDNSGIIDGGVYLASQNRLYGVFENTEDYNLQEINLTTGMVQTALQVQPLSLGAISMNDVQPNSMNAAQTEISFIMDDVSVDGRDIITPSVVVYGLVTGSFTVTPLPPRLAGIVSAPASSPMQYALSADGSLLAYQVSGPMTINDVRTTGFMTHVYNTQTGKDVTTSTGDSINLGACPTSFTFSDDDRYLVTCGAASMSENAIIEVTNTSTGAVIRMLTAGNTANYSLAPAGWAGVDTLVYTTNTTTGGQPFNAALEAVHSLNLNSSVQQNYPTGYGALLMVMH